MIVRSRNERMVEARDVVLLILVLQCDGADCDGVGKGLQKGLESSSSNVVRLKGTLLSLNLYWK
jgi:hypothetical protein